MKVKAMLLGTKTLDEAKAKTAKSRDIRQRAYVRCVVTSIFRQVPMDRSA